MVLRRFSFWLYVDTVCFVTLWQLFTLEIVTKYFMASAKQEDQLPSNEPDK